MSEYRRERAQSSSASWPRSALVLTRVRSRPSPSHDEPTRELAPPTPAGMEEMPPQQSAPDAAGRELRPAPRAFGRSPTRRTRTPRSLPSGSAAGCWSGWTSAATCSASATRSPARSPVSTSTSPARSRATSSARRRRSSTGSCRRPSGSQALQNNKVDIVVKTMTITCERRKQVAFSTVYLSEPAHPGAAGLVDLAGLRPVRQAGLRGQRHHIDRPAAADQPRRRSSCQW